MSSFDLQVDALLPLGLMPAVVPEFKVLSLLLLPAHTPILTLQE
jgi:hypothetical protein